MKNLLIIFAFGMVIGCSVKDSSQVRYKGSGVITKLPKSKVAGYLSAVSPQPQNSNEGSKSRSKNSEPVSSSSAPAPSPVQTSDKDSSGITMTGMPQTRQPVTLNTASFTRVSVDSYLASSSLSSSSSSSGVSSTGSLGSTSSQENSQIAPTAKEKSWKTVGSTLYTSGRAKSLKMVWDNEHLYAAYVEANSKNIIVKKFNGSSWNDLGNFGAGNESKNSLSLRLKDNDLYIAYINSDSNKINVKKYNGFSWENIGYEISSSGKLSEISLDFGEYDSRYIAYQEELKYSTKIILKQCEGSGWKDLQPIDNLYTSAQYVELKLNNDNIPYVMYNLKASNTVVKRLNGGISWETVGTPLSTRRISPPFITFQIDSGSFYVAYPDPQYREKVTLKTLNESSEWKDIGSPGFSSNAASWINLSFNRTDNPHVIYSEGLNDNKITVKQYDGFSWVTLGNEGFSDEGAMYSSLSFDRNDVPYVAYQEYSHGNKITVMKFD